MKVKKVSALGSALVLGLASLFSLAFAGTAAASGVTLYWCEFSSNGDFNTAANWNTNANCSSGTSEVPVSGDTLVFDNTTPTSNLAITNDISGLDIAAITFQGSGSGSYTLTGDAISLDDGITDSGSGDVNNSVNFASLTLTGNQEMNVTGADSLEIQSAIALGTNNLSLSADVTPGQEGAIVLYGLSGSGSLTFNSSGSDVIVYNIESDNSSSFSGPVNINNNAAVMDNSGDLGGLGSGTITINAGGSLTLASSSTTATLANPLVLAGSGDNTSDFGALISCLDNGSSNCAAANTNTELTLSGPITLTANTKLANAISTNMATFDLTGNLTSNGYSLTAANANTIVNLPQTTNAPGSPDTGFGLTSDNVLIGLIGVGLAGAAFLATGLANKMSAKKKNG